MRRPASSSCLLLPKGSFEVAEAEAALPAATHGSPSVTILSKDILPPYSSERFFLLSELEVHAQPTTFLSEVFADGSEDNSTQATEETEEDELPVHARAGETNPSELDSSNTDNILHTPFPPFILLYVLWSPHATSDARIFTETRIADAVTRLQESVELVSSIGSSPTVVTRQSSNGSPLNGSNGETVSTSPQSEPTTSSNVGSDPFFIEPPFIENFDLVSNGDIREATTVPPGSCPALRPETVVPRAKASLYIVVDRVLPLSSTSEPSCNIDSHSSQEDLAEDLARSVASHPVLRQCTEGITVGVSNHERAAPGLEVCVHAISLGAQDRRRNAVNPSSHVGNGTLDSVAAADRVNLDASKSLLGVVAVTPEDMLGLQDATVTDAVQGVLQSRVTAEWNGKGNLLSFAARAHNAWRWQHGVPVPAVSSGAAKRKVPRLIRRRDSRLTAHATAALGRSRGGGGGGVQPALKRDAREQIVDFLAMSLILGYILFHFGDELGDDVFRLLTAVATGWNDLIRSARGW